MPRGRRALVSGVIVGGVWVFTALAQEIVAQNPYRGDRQAVEEGERLYREAGCQSCHGPRGEGATGPALTDEVWRYRPTDETLFQVISRGIPGTRMPPWEGKLSPDQIWKIITFIRSRYSGDPSKIVW